MEPIGQATQFAQTAMDMANKVARQQAEDPSAFFPQELQNQAAQIQERFAENPSSMSITQTGNAGSAFSDMVGKLVSDVSVKQAQAGQAWQGVLSGQGVPLHQAVIASEEAAVSFQLMVEVRNKLLESFQELMRMQA
ncbi:MAG: flagellar hook-basal body complex protein FliE [Verrucomicrobiota bacterium]|nr:flagellar hook-basal body complex protein FliE [Verrucomicrobiota bacterium]MEC8719506.1 flagellar hook-basal body complex protein FliE [Verrucomicrobiota bacterium]